MGRATTAASGGPSPRNGSSGRPSSPTGRSKASASSKKQNPAKRPPTARRLFRFDRALGRRFVAGADEAGRGSLAGPLVAAAVLFDYERLTPRQVRSLRDLNDSKAHDAEAREFLYPRVLRSAARVTVTSRCAQGIDARGLHVTNLAALRDCLERVAPPDAICLVDGFNLKGLDRPQQAVIEGDARSAAIAAASVVAKVTRDRYMRSAADELPDWHFQTNVGYSTPEHREAIAVHGISVLHRRSFQSVAYQQLEMDGDAVPVELLESGLDALEPQPFS